MKLDSGSQGQLIDIRSVKFQMGRTPNMIMRRHPEMQGEQDLTNKPFTYLNQWDEDLDMLDQDEIDAWLAWQASIKEELEKKNQSDA